MHFTQKFIHFALNIPKQVQPGTPGGSGGSSGGSGSSTPVSPTPTITVSESSSELFADTGDIKIEADVKSAFGQSVEVKITDTAESKSDRKRR